MNVHRLTLTHAQPVSPPISVPQVGQSVLSSEQLLKGQREILVRHGEKLYRLRHRSNGKLILTK